MREWRRDGSRRGGSRRREPRPAYIGEDKRFAVGRKRRRQVLRPALGREVDCRARVGDGGTERPLGRIRRVAPDDRQLLALHRKLTEAGRMARVGVPARPLCGRRVGRERGGARQQREAGSCKESATRAPPRDQRRGARDRRCEAERERHEGHHLSERARRPADSASELQFYRHQ